MNFDLVYCVTSDLCPLTSGGAAKGDSSKGKVEVEEGDKGKVEEEGDKGKNQEEGEGAEGVKMEEGGDGVGGSGEAKKTEVSEKDQAKPKERYMYILLQYLIVLYGQYSV